MPECLYTIICESVRVEVNNKLSLLGVYGSSMFVGAVPTALPSLAVFQRWRPLPTDEAGVQNTYRAEVRFGGNLLISLPDQTLTIQNPPFDEFQVAYQLQGFPIAHEGEYEVLSFFNGVQVGEFTFSVTVPTPEQRNQLHLVGF